MQKRITKENGPNVCSMWRRKVVSGEKIISIKAMKRMGVCNEKTNLFLSLYIELQLSS
jgi:hypothetical protein